MTPKLQGALQALKMLQHNVESDADEMVARIAELDARRRAAMDRTHATLNAASGSLGDIEEFVGALEGHNGAPNSSEPSAALSGHSVAGLQASTVPASTEAAAKPADGFPAGAVYSLA